MKAPAAALLFMTTASFLSPRILLASATASGEHALESKLLIVSTKVGGAARIYWIPLQSVLAGCPRRTHVARRVSLTSCGGAAIDLIIETSDLLTMVSGKYNTVHFI